METTIRNVAVGYARLFPELLDRFHKNNDLTIVDLIVDKAITKIEKNIVDVSKLRKEIVDLLKNGL